MSWARVLADVVVVCHLAYVSFVLFGLVAIVVGLALRKPWARNFWFRVAHLAMIGVVVFEALVGIPCPLTTWERDLRLAAGQRVHADDFITYWTHRLLFFRAEPWVFTLAYCLVGSVVFLTFLLGPPRLPRRGPAGAATPPTPPPLA